MGESNKERERDIVILRKGKGKKRKKRGGRVWGYGLGFFYKKKILYLFGRADRVST